MEDITDADYTHAKRVCKDFEIKHLKKTKVKLDFLTDVDMLLMLEKVIRGGICHSIYQYAKTNNKYMKDYDKNKESSYFQYWDVNNLMVAQCRKSFQKIIFRRSKIRLSFMKVSQKTIMKKVIRDIFLKLMSSILKIYMNCIMIYHFYQKQWKKLVAILHDKTEYVIYVRNIKQALNHGLVLKAIHRVINFNENAWLKPYIDMNTEKNDFDKYFFKVYEKCSFWKIMENLRKQKDTKLVTTEKKKEFLSIRTKLS